MLLVSLQLAVLEEAIKILASERSNSCSMYKQTVLSWFVFLMTTCVTNRTGHGGCTGGK